MLIPTLTRRLLSKPSAPLVRHLFYERDEKGGYKDTRPRPSRTQMIRDGMKELKHEIALWTQEMKEILETDPIMVYRPGETDILWRFGGEESLQKWKVVHDSFGL